MPFFKTICEANNFDFNHRNRYDIIYGRDISYPKLDNLKKVEKMFSQNFFISLLSLLRGLPDLTL